MKKKNNYGWIKRARDVKNQHRTLLNRCVYIVVVGFFLNLQFFCFPSFTFFWSGEGSRIRWFRAISPCWCEDDVDRPLPIFFLLKGWNDTRGKNPHAQKIGWKLFEWGIGKLAGARIRHRWHIHFTNMKRDHDPTFRPIRMVWWFAYQLRSYRHWQNDAHLSQSQSSFSLFLDGNFFLDRLIQIYGTHFQICYAFVTRKHHLRDGYVVWNLVVRYDVINSWAKSRAETVYIRERKWKEIHEIKCTLTVWFFKGLSGSGMYSSVMP